MEQHSVPDPRETRPTPEIEPQPHDVALAVRAVLGELAPDADPQDVEENIAVIEEATDTEEANGAALSCFAFFGIDIDEGAARLAEILQFESVRPYGDRIRQAEAAEDSTG